MKNIGRATAFVVIFVGLRAFARSHAQDQPPRAQPHAPSSYPSSASAFSHLENSSNTGFPQFDDENDESQSAAEDGSYSASVDYYNPGTGWSNTYDLDVEVEGGRVTEIQFPNGGWISADEELDEDGNATVYDDEGREYSVHVDQ